jgi:hypothetical protein
MNRRRKHAAEPAAAIPIDISANAAAQPAVTADKK